MQWKVVLDLGFTSLNQWVKIFKLNGIFFTLISTRFLAGRWQPCCVHGSEQGKNHAISLAPQ